MGARKFRTKTVTIEAMEWTGDNTQEIVEWTGQRFMAPPAVDRARVYNELEQEWNGVPRFPYFIVRGTHGEFYPVRPDIMANRFEEIKGG